MKTRLVVNNFDQLTIEEQQEIQDAVSLYTGCFRIEEVDKDCV